MNSDLMTSQLLEAAEGVVLQSSKSKKEYQFMIAGYAIKRVHMAAWFSSFPYSMPAYHTKSYYTL